MHVVCGYKFCSLNFQSPGAVCTPPIMDAVITCNGVRAMGYSLNHSNATCNASHPVTVNVTLIDAAGYNVTRNYHLGAIIVVNKLFCHFML